WKTLLPRTRDSIVVWSIGIVGAVLSAAPALWLQQYANFMMVLGATLVPVGGVLIAHYYLASDTRVTPDGLVAALYDSSGPFRGGCVCGVAGRGRGGGGYVLRAAV